MRILIVAATEFEVEDLKTEIGGRGYDVGGQLFEVGSLESGVWSPESEVGSPDPHDGGWPVEGWNETSNVPKPKTHQIELLTTGVGMVATAFALGRHLADHEYDLAINVGIGGSFDRNLALGQVVEVTGDTFAELGVEDDERWISIDELGFGRGTFNNSYDISSGLKKVSAITVNRVHGNENSILKLLERIQPQLESMEGAAFFYACEQVNLPCVQIRAVSNYVEKRNRDAWEIGLAIKNLNSFVIELLKRLKI